MHLNWTIFRKQQHYEVADWFTLTADGMSDECMMDVGMGDMIIQTLYQHDSTSLLHLALKAKM